MNVSTIRQRLEAIADAPLEILSKTQQNALFKNLGAELDIIEKERALAELNGFRTELSLTSLSVLDDELKKRKIKTPARTAGAEEIRRHLTLSRKVWEGLGEKLEERVALLRKLRKMEVGEGLHLIKKMPPGERSALSKLAALTQLTERGARILNLSNSEKNNRLWLVKLKEATPGNMPGADLKNTGWKKIWRRFSPYSSNTPVSENTED